LIRDTRDRLRHGRQAEQVVLRHRLLRVHVHDALRLEVRDLAPSSDERHRTRNVARRDVTIDRFANSLQPLRREADVLSLAARH